MKEKPIIVIIISVVFQSLNLKTIFFFNFAWVCVLVGDRKLVCVQ